MKSKISQYIKKWERRCYSDGIPDSAPARLERAGKIPSYRTICLAILKNDMQLTSLGFTRKPCDAYMAIKRIEIEARTRKAAL
jgi:predicted phosphoadenosine phosphosulfate sulfurtransferase